MQYHLLNDKLEEPTLMEMTIKALQMLSKGSKGFVLLVESGRIDHGHHETRARLALEETRHFHEVVEYVRSRVDEKETLLVVTADHSHSMTVSGYPQSKIHLYNLELNLPAETSAGGTDILSLGDFSPEDQMAFFTLSYANGMGFYDHYNESGRVNPLDMDYGDPLFMQPTTVPLQGSTHGGDDVGVYAIGPHSHLFTGVYEQHYLAHAMMYATCLGPDTFLKAQACSSVAVVELSQLMIILCAALVLIAQ